MQGNGTVSNKVQLVRQRKRYTGKTVEGQSSEKRDWRERESDGEEENSVWSTHSGWKRTKTLNGEDKQTRRRGEIRNNRLTEKRD